MILFIIDLLVLAFYITIVKTRSAVYEIILFAANLPQIPHLSLKPFLIEIHVLKQHISLLNDCFELVASLNRVQLVLGVQQE